MPLKSCPVRIFSFCTLFPRGRGGGCIFEITENVAAIFFFYYNWHSPSLWMSSSEKCPMGIVLSKAFRGDFIDQEEA